MKTAPLATLCFSCLLGIMSVTVSAGPYEASADGSEVLDQKTGLIWRRCVEGMFFTRGTCAETPLFLTFTDAVRQASTEAARDGLAWRLPNIDELLSIVDNHRSNPAIDTSIFPATPLAFFWSATRSAKNNNVAKVVHFSNASTDNVAIGNSGFVRLVRSSQ